MPKQITPEMQVADIFELAPDSVVVMTNSGLKCTGCDARTDVSLQKMMDQQDFPEEKQLKLLKHLNKLNQNDQEDREPEPKDFEVQEIQESNKKYYKLAGLMLTENAYKNLHQLADKRGLRIQLTTGGCSGFKYEFDYCDGPQHDGPSRPNVAGTDSQDHGPTKESTNPHGPTYTFKLSDQLAIYMDDFTFSRSYGAVVDFPISLHSSGLQIHNPNQKRSCSCGTSIGF